MDKNPHKFYESAYFVMILAIVGGFLDAYTYILRGGVFANAQTGNVVLVGVYLAEGEWLSAVKVIPSILAFVVGGILVEGIKSAKQEGNGTDWVRIILMSKIGILLMIGFIPQHVPDIFIIITISFLASVQVSSFKTMGDTPCSTTMITGNLRYCMDHAIHAFREKESVHARKAIRYIVIIIAFLLGAVMGGIFIDLYQHRSIWICAGLLFILLFGYHLSEKSR